MDVLIYIGKSAGILSMFYIVYYFVLRKDTFFTANRHFLGSGILAAIFLPLLTFTKTTYVEVSAADLSESTTQTFNGIPAMQNIAPSFTIDWWQVLLIVYAIGCIIMGIHLLLQLFSLVRLLRKYPSQKRGLYTFVEVDAYISPFSFFSYIVFNPKLHSENEIEMILAHEKVHARQWHSIDILLANLIRIAQWINPIAWLYKKGLEENLEFIADDHTVQIIASKKEYQLALVKASSTLYAPALTVQFYQSFIKKRIIMLNKSNSNKYNQLKLSIILPLLAVFLWSFNVTEVVSYTAKTAANEVTELAQPETSEAVVEPNNPAITVLTKPTTELAPVRSYERNTNKATQAAQQRSVAGSDKADPIAKEAPKKHISVVTSLQKPELTVTKDFKFTITSKTTDTELAQFKAELKKEHGVTMTYDVVRNGNGEITSLTFSYSGSGNNGSYSINEDEPIDDFYFYIQENGDTGFWSGNHTKHQQKRMLKRSDKMEERHEQMDERRALRDEHLIERKEQLESSRGEMAERREEMRERMHKDRKDMHEAMKERKHLKKDQEDHEEHVMSLNRSHAKARSGGVNGYSYRSSHSGDRSLILDKNTSDATLEKMKQNLAEKGITFSYSKVKRNSNGELTRIKIDVDNGKGNKQSIFTKTDDGEPIDEMVIQM